MHYRLGAQDQLPEFRSTTPRRHTGPACNVVTVSATQMACSHDSRPEKSQRTGLHARSQVQVVCITRASYLNAAAKAVWQGNRRCYPPRRLSLALCWHKISLQRP